MDKSEKVFLSMLLGFFLSLAGVTGLCFYMDGQAKSHFLKQTRSLEIPWYEAAFLEVDVNSVDADVRVKP